MWRLLFAALQDRQISASTSSGTNAGASFKNICMMLKRRLNMSFANKSLIVADEAFQAILFRSSHRRNALGSNLDLRHPISAFSMRGARICPNQRLLNIDVDRLHDNRGTRNNRPRQALRIPSECPLETIDALSSVLISWPLSTRTDTNGVGWKSISDIP